MKRKAKHKSKNGMLWVGGAVVVIMAAVGWYALKPAATVPPSNAAGLPPPKVATLDPNLFKGVAKDSYQAAKEVPEVLQQMPCYCGCMRNGMHENNLECFADYHAEECDVCQRIALDARDMYKAGTAVDQIRAKIRARYER